MSNHQTIEIGGKKAVVLPIEEYQVLVQRAEMLDDIEDFDRAMARLAAGEDTLPADIVKRLIAGDSPVRVFREYRGLSQQDLADAAGISVPAISKIERTGQATVATFKALAERLGLSIGDLIS